MKPTQKQKRLGTFVLFAILHLTLFVSSCGQGLCAINNCGVPTAQSADQSVLITITGMGFQSGATVVVNGVNCSGVTVISTTTLSCTLPSTSIKVTNVVVTNANGQTTTVNPGARFVKTITTLGGGNFTVPENVTSLQIELVGGGAGGGGSDKGKTSTSAGGGGGGAYVKATKAVAPGQTIQYSVGGGGAGSTTLIDDGANGTPSTCSTFSLTAGGGSSAGTGGGLAGPSGSASGGDINTSGGAGVAGIASGGNGSGGRGAAPIGGAGGNVNTSTPPYTGGNGSFPGGGGAGGFDNDPLNPGYGGAGANGEVIFTYSVQ